ncbi:RNA polymerase sigma-70 factor [Ravibacter arvi]|uniref:RNA polymerase sigma-70 factor n=1 Tax=Ravibacter arvi TaxID=2051041 RepID=A0ABP8LXT2_9BACT
MPDEWNEHTFETLYRTYWLRLYNFVLAKVHDPDTAEEIIQDLFSTLWEKRGELRIVHLKSYLFAAARNRVIDFYKQQLFSNLDGIDHPLAPDYPFFLDELETQLQQALEQLPAKTREIFMMNRLEGKSAGEISANLNLPKRTVEYHITQGLRFLRSALGEVTPLVLALSSAVIF